MPADYPQQAVLAVAALAALAAAAAAVFLILWRRALRGIAEAAAKLQEARKALSELKAAPRRHEVRLERFELLWYPTLIAYEAAQEVVGVAAGLPHCRACVKPLAAKGGGWSCPGCAKEYPDSLADVQVTDAVANEAVKLFLERRPGWKVSLKKA